MSDLKIKNYLAIYAFIKMLSSFSQFSGKLSIKLTLEYHMVQLCLSTQTTEPLPVSTAEPLLPGYKFISQTMMHKVHSWHRTRRGGRSVRGRSLLIDTPWQCEKKSKPRRPAQSLTKINAAPGVQQSHIAAEGTAWVVLMGGNLDVYQQGALTAVRANLLTSCINKRTIS